MKTLYGLTIVLTGAALLSSGLWAQNLQTQSSVGVQPQVTTNSNPAPAANNNVPATPAANVMSQPSTAVTKSVTTPVTKTRTNTPLDSMGPPASLPGYCKDPVTAAQVLQQWTQDYNAAVAEMLQSQAASDKCYGSMSNMVVKGTVSDYYNCTKLGQVPGETGPASYCVSQAQYDAANAKAADCMNNYNKTLNSTASSATGNPKSLKADMRAFNTACPRPPATPAQRLAWACHDQPNQIICLKNPPAGTDPCPLALWLTTQMIIYPDKAATLVDECNTAKNACDTVHQRTAGSSSGCTTQIGSRWPGTGSH